MSDKIKLIIEIPKNIYARCKDYKLWSYDAETLEGAVATSRPLSEVLAEIREEIDNLDMEYDCNTYYGGISDALEIIDKHISGDDSK